MVDGKLNDTDVEGKLNVGAVDVDVVVESVDGVSFLAENAPKSKPIAPPVGKDGVVSGTAIFIP